MEMRLPFFFFFFFFIFISFFTPSCSSSQAPPTEPAGDTNYWCSTTPHPDLCRRFARRSRPKCRAEFLLTAVEAALHRALHARSHSRKLGRRCRSRHERAVWTDCSKLIDDTVLQLNTTFHGLKTNGSCTDLDAQTWLSAALTNLETCRRGSGDLNLSDGFILPLVSGNVSELISNCLAINGALVEQREDKDEGFPSWVSRSERKLLESSSSLQAKATVVVSKDGSGSFRSIQEAINRATATKVGNGRIIVYVKRGVYSENVDISRAVVNLTLVGDGLRNTIITGSRSVSMGYTTYSTATVGVDGFGFIARGITFRNTAGQEKGQAVALRSASDLSVFYACAFEGYQDTLFVQAQRQFFKSCVIYGTVDFIFGNAAVVFQNCNLYARKPLPGQANTITAQGRGDPFQNTGISIQNSRILAAADLTDDVQTYLGRPWQEFSRTAFLKCYMGSLVNPAGWSAWGDTNFAQDTLYYGEYKNFGPGASTDRRVNWPGYHVITDATVAAEFTAANLIAGRTWLGSTGVPFATGL
ncbi:probable pectinesterase/pectinesterase inhibitor 59 [Diospyros lotus]|uniref:probable pectinesterase/pectinesterase inhibitor 59 n=1 Tax=Diospyros lotus TaxID=55363 RepID=UPI002256D969|nr:probable pectinesterase/pectinesterase inhibitor 59 [Diospyros lotus]